jgi:hypothetical protein
VSKVSEALSARILLLKLIVPKAQTLTLAHFSSLYTLGTFYKVAEGLIQGSAALGASGGYMSFK